MARQWHVGAGDLRFGAVLVIVGYVAAATLALAGCLVARRARIRLAAVDRGEARAQSTMAALWIAVAATLVVLAVGRGLDLETWFVRTMRRLSYEEGWYDRRRELQGPVIVAVLLAGVVLAALLARWLPRGARRLAGVRTAVVALLVFTVVRTISFHDVDQLLSLGGRLWIGSLVEAALLALVVAAALRWHLAERRVVAAALAAGAAVPATLPAPASVRT